MRRFIIDTDTGSDDAWAIVEALRAQDIIRVEAITAVCGNLPLDMCLKNAMIAEDAAGRDCPPVYRGCEFPLQGRISFYAPEVHGSDGLSEMNLPMPKRSVGAGHAVDALIQLVMENPGEIEIAAIGPLTNIATAVRKEPAFAANVKKIWILGGSGRGIGNMTEAAEYNVYADPEAADIVLKAGFASTWVTWDAFCNGGEISWKEMEELAASEDPAARFCERCARTLKGYYYGMNGRESLGVIDTVLMTVAIYPEVMTEVFSAECGIVLEHGEKRGFFEIDRESGKANAEVCITVNASEYKKKLFGLIGGQ